MRCRDPNLSHCDPLPRTAQVVVAGVKYMFVSGDANEVYCKKGNEGVVFCKCNTCILVGYHNDKIQPGSCRTTVGKLADFLKENNI